MDDDDLFSDFIPQDTGPIPEQHRYYVKDPRPTSTGAVQNGGNDLPPQPQAMPQSAARGAGVSVVFAGIGLGIGYSFGGLWGAGAGLLLAGAVRNGARAKKLWGDSTQEGREEAASSATMSVIGGGIGAYLAYRAYQEQLPE